MAEQVVQTPSGKLGPQLTRKRRSRLRADVRASLESRRAARAASLLPKELQAGAVAGRAAARGLPESLRGAGAVEAALGGAGGTAARSAGQVSALRRFAPLAALVGPLVGLAGLNRITQLRERGKQVREQIGLLQDPAETDALIQQEILRERLQENLIAAKLARMQNVARNDPNLFKMLSAMVAGSQRPRTTASAIRVGPEPTQLDMLQSGLF